MFSFRQSARLAPVLAAALVVACGSTATDSASTAMTQVEADAAADIVVSDLFDQTEGATATTASTAFLASAPVGGDFAVVRPWWATCTPAPTRTVVGSTVTFVFDNCVSTRLTPPETLTRDGTVAITAEAGLRRVVYTDFEKVWERTSFRTGQTTSLTETKNGTRQVTRDDGSVLTRSIYGATVSDPFRTTWAVDGATGTHLKRWNASFTADVAQSIVRDQELPAGRFALTGTSEWTRTLGSVSRNWSFQVQTGSQGVHYNPACVAAGPNFDSGSLTVVATGRSGTVTTLVITFTGCGQYTTTRS